MVAAALMLVAAFVEALFGIDSEGRSLEQTASPLSSMTRLVQHSDRIIEV